MKRAGTLSLVLLFWAAAGCGSDTEKPADAAEDVPVVDISFIQDTVLEVPSAPIVQPVCDPDGLAPPGIAIPMDDFTKPPSETRPFPNLALAVFDDTSPTGLRPAFQHHAFSSILNALDGFGSTAPFLVPLATPPHAASLADGSVFLVRTDGADDPELNPNRLPEARVPVDVAWNAEAGVLVVEPLTPLEERARYALVVTRCLKDESGKSVGRAPAMDDLPSPGDGDSPLLEEMDRARRFLNRFDVNLPDEAVALVLPTVVRSTTSRLRTLAKVAAQAVDFNPVIEWAVAPALPDGTLSPDFLAKYDGLAEFIDDEIEKGEEPLHFYDSIEVVAQGHFTAKRYLDPGKWTEMNGGETLEPVEDLEIRFFLTIPREDPEAGLIQPFPVVVFQHAFGVCKETAIGIAGAYSRQGLATIGIDAVAHGHRAEGGDWKCGVDPMAFITLGEPLRLWYNFAESAMDLAQLATMARELDLDLHPFPGGDGKPDLLGGVVGVTGQSMGAFLSATAMGFQDGIGPAVINVGGGQEGLFFAWGMVSSSGADPMALSFANVNGLVLDIMAPIQMAFDDVEPLVFAKDMFGPEGTPDRQVLIQQAIEDSAVPGACTMRLARTLGVPQLKPGFHEFPDLQKLSGPIRGNMDGNRTGALTQFLPARHEFLLTNHQTDQDPDLLLRVQTQAAVFIRTFFDEGVSTIIDPYDDEVLAPYKPREEL